jgi:hypothetical protein
VRQDFHKPFDAPAVIVVGHQTSGKSALIEALMGFQVTDALSIPLSSPLSSPLYGPYLIEALMGFQVTDALSIPLIDSALFLPLACS